MLGARVGAMVGAMVALLGSRFQDCHFQCGQFRLYSQN